MEIRKRTGKYTPKRQKIPPRRPISREEKPSSDMRLFNQLVGASAIIICAVIVNIFGGGFENGVSVAIKKHTTLAEINTNLVDFAKSVPVIGQFFENNLSISVFENLFGKNTDETDGDGAVNTSTVIVDPASSEVPTDFVSGFDLEKYKELPSTTEEDGGGTSAYAEGKPSVDTLGLPSLAEISAAVSLPYYLKEQSPYRDITTTFSNEELKRLSSFQDELPEIELKTTQIPENVILTKVDLPIKLSYPLNGSISSEFGIRTDPFSKTIKFHHGLDIAAAKGTAIKPIAEGEVIEVGKNSIYGNYIVLKHKGNITSKYAHCSKIYAKKGDKVKTSTKIASVGSTGNSTGNHVHLEIKHNLKFIDPKLNLSK